MISSEVLKKIRRIHITTNRMVSDAFAGQYHSVFKGKGLEFEEVREYQPGDDIRSIDWNVTARMGHPFIKKFAEERELTILLLLDLSSSCHFGTVHQSKRQLGAELCALLALSAAKNNDKVGLILFTDRVERFVSPRKGVRHILRIIRDALYFQPQGQGTDIALALEYMHRVVHRRSVGFLLSDFYDAPLKSPLSVAGKRHDFIAVTLTDPVELNLPETGITQFHDPETKKTFLIDTSDQSLRKEYRIKAQKRLAERTDLFNSVRVDHVDIRTDVPYLRPVINFFRMREKRISTAVRRKGTNR
jgi:uncharacterized protein (DUF58 family)